MNIKTAEKVKTILKQGKEPHLMTGEQYKESLRDGRRIIDGEGKEVKDVTTHPHLKNAVESMAELYDAQFDEDKKYKTTYIDSEDGERYSLSWMIPQTEEDLERKRELIKYTTYKTFGIFGRPFDYGGLTSIGFLLIADKLAEQDPHTEDNLRSFIDFNKKHNLLSTDLVPDVQSDRTVPAKDRPGRLRVVEEREDGIVLYGAKPAASGAAHSHFVTIATSLAKDPDPNAIIWAAVPINSEGLSLVLREPSINTKADFNNHPLDSYGEEMDNMLVFDNVFIPYEYVFSIKNPKVFGFYGESGVLSHWHILVRLMYRAELFAGVAQTTADILATDSFQGVREDITEVISYAATLKAFILASEKQATIKNGIKIPEEELITAGRLHSIENYPKIIHILRDLSGQGLISRFTVETWNHPDVGEKFDEFLRGTGVSAMEKNRFFNFVWDLTCSSHASRVALFENVNSTNATVVKSLLYSSYNRSDQIDYIRDYLNMTPKNK